MSRGCVSSLVDRRLSRLAPLSGLGWCTADRRQWCDSDHPTERDLLMQPTIVLVHGAFAESASWDRVIDPLLSAGHPVIAAANPLRGLASDAAAVSDLVRTIDGPVVLVAHSYGGAVISNVDADAGAIAGLLYVRGRRGSCSARNTAASRPPPSTSWPSAPARATRSGSVKHAWDARYPSGVQADRPSITGMTG